MLTAVAPGAVAHDPVTIADIESMERRAAGIVSKVRGNSYAPTGNKTAVRFSLTQLSALCGKSVHAMSRLLDKAEERGLGAGEPPGVTPGDKKRRMFSLAEAIGWVRAVSDTYVKRAPGVLGCVITVGNFKGGVSKTITSTSLAQALSLKGYKVLCIDLDPQGSMTSLFDLDRMEVDDEQTILPVMLSTHDEGYRDTLQESIQETYWPGIDLIAGAPSLFSAEFYLPLRQMNSLREEPGFKFTEVLNNALSKGIRQEYDYIIIDTPPALSYVTLNAFWAADGLLMPLPPEGLDLMSSTRFWSMFTSLSRSAEKTGSKPKTFSFVKLVAAKVDATKPYTQFNLDVMRKAYGDHVLAATLPLSSAVSVGGTTLATVYDMEKYVGAAKTYQRARAAFDQLADQIDYLTRTLKWGLTVAAPAPAAAQAAAAPAVSV